jgi:hypothetical protein
MGQSREGAAGGDVEFTAFARTAARSKGDDTMRAL